MTEGLLSAEENQGLRGSSGEVREAQDLLIHLRVRALAHRYNTIPNRLRGGGTKSSTDPAVADQLLAKIDEISKIFWETKQG